jgi:hypothetical protein
VIRFELAGNLLIHLDLNGRMADVESLLQLMRDLHQRFITGMAARHQAVARQSGLGCAHRPDMQVVNCGHARLLFQETSDVARLDSGRHRRTKVAFCVQRVAGAGAGQGGGI